MTEPALDLTHRDPAVRPADDLYRAVNGGWLATTEIPADKASWGAFTELADRAEEQVRAIVEELAASQPEPGSEAAKIADLYAAFMDEDAIEQAGAEPLTTPLLQAEQVTDPESLLRVCGWLFAHGYGSLLGMGPESDPMDPTRMVLFVGQGGIGLPDEAYYRDEDKAEIRAHYVAHMERMFALAGFEDAAEQAQRVMELETAIAACHWDRVRCRDLEQMYNPMSLEEWAASAPGLDVRAFVAEAGLDERQLASLVNAQPSFFTAVAAVVQGHSLAQWQSWVRWRVIGRLAMFLSSPFVEERFHFTGTVLSGTPTLRARWKRGVGLVQGVLGEAVGKIYVERHFPSTHKERMDELVANLLEAYRRSISELDWMTSETRAKALDKLSKFRPKIGYPTKWRDYSALDVRPGDLIGNLERATKFELDYELAKVGAPRDVEEWLMTPQTVNAYYHPFYNEIVFPAAILQPPFFNVDADDAVNYGGIGAVIGHEIGHGFDDQGSTCDGDGRLANWWTDADRAAFEERTGRLIGQYDALHPSEAPDVHVNGALTIGENIGDLGGLGIAIRAWRIATGGDVPEIDGLSGLQRLFFGNAQVWRSKLRPEAMRTRIATDPHSPAEFRCNQVARNLDAFYEAFEVGPDDALWLDPSERVKIW